MKLSSTFIKAIGEVLLCACSLTAQTDQRAVAEHGSDIPKKVAVDSGRTAVPMTLEGRKPVVDVRVNGKGPFKFFLDTGAGATVMDQRLADELHLPTDGTTKIGDPSDPEGISAMRDRIDKLEIGGATFSDLIAVSWDRSTLYKENSPRGVLGMPLFRELLLTIDYPKNQVVISNGSLPGANGSNVLEYRFTEGDLFGIPIKVGKEDMFATLDTGSPGSLSFPSSYMDTLALESKPVEVGRARTVGGEAIVYGAKLKDSIKFGGQVFENPNITFFGRLTHLNVGYGLVSQFALTIDQKNRRIKFEKSATGEAVVESPHSMGNKSGKFDPYTGQYGVRRITAENDELFLQRISGPQGEGPKLKLAEISKDAFAISGQTEVRIKIVRDADGKITGLQILNPSGEWESSKKDR